MGGDCQRVRKSDNANALAELRCRAQWARRGKGSSRIPHEPKVASRCRRGDLQSETHEGITRLTPGTVIRPASPPKTKPIGMVWSQKHRSEERRVGKECRSR